MSQSFNKINLNSRGFFAFISTQFLGAMNDNIFKMVISLFAINAAAQSDGGSGALSLISAIFIIPFILFSGYAGQWGDIQNKRAVLIITKSMEIVSMILGLFAFLTLNIYFMLAVLFLMSLQSTLFSPSKYGILPEILEGKELSRANGWLEMSTFLAIILGTILGGFFFEYWSGQLWLIAIFLIAIALLGSIVSFGIAKAPEPVEKKPFLLNPYSEIISGFKRMAEDKPLRLTIAAIGYFWFLGALIQMVVLLLGKQTLGVSDLQTSLLGTYLAIGIGAGSIVAGMLSGDKIELGLVPIGSIGIGFFSLFIFLVAPSYWLIVAGLVFLGFFSGIFIVPLNAFLQYRSRPKEKGRMIATSNFVTTVGIFIASGALYFTSNLLSLTPEQIILVFGIVTFGVTVYILTVLPDFLIRFTLWILTNTLYRIRLQGAQNIPLEGPALLVCNHVSHADALLVAACVQRFIRFMVYKPIYEMKALHWLFKLMNAIPVDGANRKVIIQSIRRAREELQNGEVVCIFAEGAVSRSGNLLPFKRGLEKIVDGLDVPIIPIHIDRIWGSIFSFKNGKFFWKWPERIPYPVTVSVGDALPANAAANDVRQAVQQLGTQAFPLRYSERDTLPIRWIKTARKRRAHLAMADSSGNELTFGKALIATFMLERWLRGHASNETNIGLLLPPCNGGALCNIAVALAGKVSVNLNFTSGPDNMKSMIEQCGLQTIITSKIFIKKAHIEETKGMVFLEDIMKGFGAWQKGLAAFKAYCVPTQIFRGTRRGHIKDLATIIFSSGSTGMPKGVMLSHENIIANVESVTQTFHIHPEDKILGTLPFFHSFGITVTIWFPFITGFTAVYHANPIDAKTIGTLARERKATVFISTSTFCSAYVRKCDSEDFASMRLVVVGAEKLREPVAKAFQEKFGIELLQGYGCTEMGPVVSVNAPDVHDGPVTQLGNKPGSVGLPIPGASVKILDLNTLKPLGIQQEGLLFAHSPSRMMGYYKQDELTNAAIVDGWYNTGDIAKLDEDGFIFITDRLSRFSKIGGEMVPHVRIEEAIHDALNHDGCAVTSVPDESKGERLVVLYRDEEFDVNRIWEHLNQSGMPKLWIPKRDDFYAVEELPVLGSGKLDLKGLKELAKQRASG